MLRLLGRPGSARSLFTPSRRSRFKHRAGWPARAPPHMQLPTLKPRRPASAHARASSATLLQRSACSVRTPLIWLMKVAKAAKASSCSPAGPMAAALAPIPGRMLLRLDRQRNWDASHCIHQVASRLGRRRRAAGRAGWVGCRRALPPAPAAAAATPIESAITQARLVRARQSQEWETNYRGSILNTGERGPDGSGDAKSHQRAGSGKAGAGWGQGKTGDRALDGPLAGPTHTTRVL